MAALYASCVAKTGLPALHPTSLSTCLLHSSYARQRRWPRRCRQAIARCSIINSLGSSRVIVRQPNCTGAVVLLIMRLLGLNFAAGALLWSAGAGRT